MANSSLLILGVFSIAISLVSCTEFNVASPTASRMENLGRAPEPTAPAILAEEAAELIERDVYNTICGYVSGDLEYPVTCGGGYICATQAYYDVAGCCNPNDLENCLLADTCIPYGYTCDAACQESYAAYTSCGYLAPYCFTKFYNYGAGYYEYDCATANGFITIEASAFNAPATQYVVTTAAVVTQTKASASAATEVADSSGSVTNIYNGNNDCQSNCGTGNSNGGSGNNVGNKSGSRINIPSASLGLRLLSALYISLLIFL